MRVSPCLFPPGGSHGFALQSTAELARATRGLRTACRLAARPGLGTGSRGLADLGRRLRRLRCFGRRRRFRGRPGVGSDPGGVDRPDGVVEHCVTGCRPDRHVGLRPLRGLRRRSRSWGQPLRGQHGLRPVAHALPAPGGRRRHAASRWRVAAQRRRSGRPWQRLKAADPAVVVLDRYRCSRRGRPGHR